MASLEPFVMRIKPSMDAFFRNPTKQTLDKMHRELTNFNWIEMKIFHVQILAPLVLFIAEITSEELRIGVINCITFVTSQLYLKDVKAVRLMLTVALTQVQAVGGVTQLPNLSEELKLATVSLMTECLKRSASDVREQFYTIESSGLLAKMLMILVDFIETERYRKISIASMECLMAVFYVHDEADIMDLVLRSQVADTLFIYLPKIVTTLMKSALSDEKMGETFKSTAVKTLGRILWIVFEGSNENIIKTKYTASEFKNLLEDIQSRSSFNQNDDEILGTKRNIQDFEQRIKRMRGSGRSKEWFAASSRKLRPIFEQLSILRAHESQRMRLQYAEMCCNLLRHTANNLKENFLLLLDSVLAMTEDEDANICLTCKRTLDQMQNNNSSDIEGLFDMNCELLFDEHLTKLPRIIHRCDEREQFAAFISLKAFLCNVSTERFQSLLTLPRHLETVCIGLVTTVELKITSSLLVEEYALRDVSEQDIADCEKLNWRQFKFLSSERCVNCVQEICEILGRTETVSSLIFDYFLELIPKNRHMINETLLVMLWMATGEAEKEEHSKLIHVLLDEVLSDYHWHLALEADQRQHLKVSKDSYWYKDSTPGLYESAIEMRLQDYDTDDEEDLDEGDATVTAADVQYNVLHTCIVLDVLGHCSTLLGDSFDRYVFKSLHKVLLKVASSNSMVYQAAIFALVSIRKALYYSNISQLIETNTNYLTYHLKKALKQSPENSAAIDILSVILQFSTREALPHLEDIFENMREECARTSQTENKTSYLKVFNAFLGHISRWEKTCKEEFADSSMDFDEETLKDYYADWMNILEKPDIKEDFNMDSESKDVNESNENPGQITEDVDINPVLPRHIEVVKSILKQVLKFISSTAQSHQILAIECLLTGLPLLRDYENELLPLVHETWQPFVEKFRQKDPLVINRCFSLLDVLATLAKDFIRKRSLDDIVPYLKQFLQTSARNSANQQITAKTQEQKLQLKLLSKFENLIKCLEIDGKHLNEICEVISLYLADNQPKEFQEVAITFYISIFSYNGPLTYLVVIKKHNMKNFKANVDMIIQLFNL